MRFGARHESIASRVDITDALRPRRGAALRSVSMTMCRSGIELSADNSSLVRNPVGAVACINAMFFHDNLMGKAPISLKSRKKAANLRQPNQLLLTGAEKLVNLKVQRTDWALLGIPWGALSFWVAGRAPFLFLLVRNSVRLLF